MMNLEKSWRAVLHEEIKKPYIQRLKDFLAEERRGGVKVYPPEPLVFSAFSHTPVSSVKVVLVGQDPYHGEGQAHGLCFSVPCGVLPPPSLKNIFKEIKEDIGQIPFSPCLSFWGKQGVLMLNATLTVRANEPKSHEGRGWETFTDAVIAALYQQTDPLVFLLWGKFAQEKVARVMQGRNSPHQILTAPHPSPLSAHTGFLGCRHFSKTNHYLRSWGKGEIDWVSTSI